MRQQLAKLDLLVLDELGYVPASKAGAELLFDIIATAYERNSLVVITNLPFRSPRQRTAHGSSAGQAYPPLPHSGDEGRELPSAGRQAATTTVGLTRGSNQPRHPTDSGENDTTKRHHFGPPRHGPRAAVFNRRQQQILLRRL